MECFSYDRADGLVCLKERCRSALCYFVDRSTAELSQCLLFFAFLCEPRGDRDLDLPALWSGDGDRERLDRLGDLNKTEDKILTLKITLRMDATAKASVDLL